MNSLVRKALLLIAPAAAVGCAQLPRDPSADAVFDRNAGLQALKSADVVRTSASLEAQGQKDPALPSPRPVHQGTKMGPDGPATAEPLDSPTLEDLETLTDRVNPILVRDRANVDAARGNAVQAGIWSNPRFDTNNPEVFTGRTSLFNVGFQQEIPVAGKKKLDQSAANEMTRQAEIALNQDRAALHASIRQQFYAVLVDQERVRVLGRTEDLVRKSYETGVARQKAGDLGSADVVLLLVDYQRAQGALRSARAILEGDRKQLEALVGQPGCVRGEVKGQLTGSYPEFDERKLIEYVTRNHTQILFALSVVRQNQILLRRAQVDPIPNPTLGPAYQFGVIPGADQFWFNMTFAIPTWDFNQGNIRQARGNLASSAASVDAARLNLINQAANFLSQYLAARAYVERFEGKGKAEPGMVANANEAVRLYQIMFANKTTDLATLLQAQRTAMQTNSDYVDKLQDLWNNASQLSGILQLERFP